MVTRQTVFHQLDLNRKCHASVIIILRLPGALNPELGMFPLIRTLLNRDYSTIMRNIPTLNLKPQTPNPKPQTQNPKL